jgi:hypothetical protein
MERLILMKQNEEECNKKYHAETSNMLAALEDLDAEVEKNNVQENIRENIKISAKESLGYYE